MHVFRNISLQAHACGRFPTRTLTNRHTFTQRRTLKDVQITMNTYIYTYIDINIYTPQTPSKMKDKLSNSKQNKLTFTFIIVMTKYRNIYNKNINAKRKAI